MKIAFIGNICNVSYDLLKSFRQFGLEGTLYYDSSEHPQHKPNNVDPDLDIQKIPWLRPFGKDLKGFHPWRRPSQQALDEFSRFDLIHCQNIGLIWAHQSGLPYIWKPHGWDSRNFPFYCFWLLYHSPKQLSKYPEYITAPIRYRRAISSASSLLHAVWSPEAKRFFDLLPKLNIKLNQKLTPLYLTIDVNKFKLKAPENEQNNIHSLLKLNGIDTDINGLAIFKPTRINFELKKSDLLVRVLARFSSTGRKFTLILPRKGKPDEVKFEEMLRQHSLSNNIIWIPYQSRSQLIHWYQACDLVIDSFLPFGMGSISIEAMACGAPLMRGYLTEYSDPNFFLPDFDSHPPIITANSEQDALDNLILYADNPDLLKKRGLEGREWVLRNVSPEVLYPRYMDIYQKAVYSHPIIPDFPNYLEPTAHDFELIDKTCKHGSIQQAMSAFAEALDRNPEHPVLLGKLYNHLRSHGFKDLANTFFRDLAELEIDVKLKKKKSFLPLKGKKILLAAKNKVHAMRLYDLLHDLLNKNGALVICACSVDNIDSDLMEYGFIPITNDIESNDSYDAAFILESTVSNISSNVPVISIPHAFKNGNFPNSFNTRFAASNFYCCEQPPHVLRNKIGEFNGCISKRSSEIHFLPSGSLKLDALKKACDTVTVKDAIMYCTNPIDHGSTFFIDGKIMISMILLNFPEYKLIVRPYPGDEQHPQFQKIISPFLNHERFELDITPSTLFNTPRARVVISNKSSTGLIFSYATLQPHIDYSREGKARNNISVIPCGLKANNIDQLRTAIQICLDKGASFQSIIQNERDSRIYKAGYAEEILIDDLTHILNRQKKSEWVKLNVNKTGSFNYSTSDDEAEAFISHMEKRLDSLYSVFVPLTYTTWHNLYKSYYWGTRAAKRKDIIVFNFKMDSPYELRIPSVRSILPFHDWEKSFFAWGRQEQFEPHEKKFISTNNDFFRGFFTKIDGSPLFEIDSIMFPASRFFESFADFLRDMIFYNKNNNDMSGTHFENHFFSDKNVLGKQNDKHDILIKNNYSGAKAATYDSSRSNNLKWQFETNFFKCFLDKYCHKISSIIDAPVGTGRFIVSYNKLSHVQVFCLDYSDDMLIHAKSKQPNNNISFFKRDVINSKIDFKVDSVICFRFLNLIEWSDASKALLNLMNSTKKYILFTIRLVDDNYTGSLYIEDKIYLHRKDVFFDFLRKNDFSIIKQDSFADSRPGEYFAFLCHRNNYEINGRINKNFFAVYNFHISDEHLKCYQVHNQQQAKFIESISNDPVIGRFFPKVLLITGAFVYVQWIKGDLLKYDQWESVISILSNIQKAKPKNVNSFDYVEDLVIPRFYRTLPLTGIDFYHKIVDTISQYSQKFTPILSHPDLIPGNVVKNANGLVIIDNELLCYTRHHRIDILNLLKNIPEQLRLSLLKKYFALSNINIKDFINESEYLTALWLAREMGSYLVKDNIAEVLKIFKSYKQNKNILPFDINKLS